MSDGPDGGTSPPGGAPSGQGSGQGSSHGSGTGGGAASGTGSGAGSGAGSGGNVDAARGDNTNTAAPPAPDSPITLTVQCAHNRQVTNDGSHSGTMLQIVPNVGQTNLQTGLTIQSVVQLTVGTATGGTDTITATINTSDGTCAGQPAIAITQADAPADSDWQGGMTATQNVPTPGDTSLVWLDGAQPTVYNVFARGSPDDTPTQVIVQAFPAYSVSGSVSLNFLNDFISVLNNAMKDTIGSFCSSVFGGSVTVQPQIIGPSGKIGVSCGWKENSDWQAYYAWEIDVGLEPIFGISWTISGNLLAIAGSAVSIPPQLTDYLAGLTLSLQVSGQVGCSGTLAQGGPTAGVTGSVVPDGTVGIQVSMGVRAGNDKVVSVQLTGSASSSLTFKATVSYQSGGQSGSVVFNPSVTWNGISVGVNLITSAYGEQMTNNQLCQWVMIGPQGPWQPNSPYVLLGN